MVRVTPVINDPGLDAEMGCTLFCKCENLQRTGAFEADSADALSYLKQHYELVILSNIDNKSFAHSNAKLGVVFDAVYTAQDVGAYKPADKNFEYMLSHLDRRGIASEDILHTAESLFHDHLPAARHGLTSCWIYRRHDQKGYGATRDPGEKPDVAFQFNSMADLVEAHKAELLDSAA